MFVQILIVDDHSVVRRGLRMFLEDDPELQIVGEARDGAEAVTQARALKPHAVLMDLLMPGMDGITGGDAHPRRGAIWMSAAVSRDAAQ